MPEEARMMEARLVTFQQKQRLYQGNLCNNLSEESVVWLAGDEEQAVINKKSQPLK